MIVGTSHPEDVSRSVIRAIKYDVGHVMVSPIRTKFFVKISSLSPPLGELLMNALGVVRWLKDVEKTGKPKDFVKTLVRRKSELPVAKNLDGVIFNCYRVHFRGRERITCRF